MAYVCDCLDVPGNAVLDSCPTTLANCQYVVESASDLLFLHSQVSSENIIYVFAWGSASVLGLFALGYTVGIIKRALNFA